MGHSCLAARFAYLMSAREGESPSLPYQVRGRLSPHGGELGGVTLTPYQVRGRPSILSLRERG